MQGHFELIRHRVEGGEVIPQRPQDGYINATAMCRAAGKRWPDYWRLPSAKEFADELSAVVHIHTTELIQTNAGGEPRLQGTWVHPQVAIHLAQWLSPQFAVRVSKWVYDWISGNAPPAVIMPYHLRRYTENQPNVPDGHFSVLGELTILLIGPLERMGYTLPEAMLPDISQGQMFCRWLRDSHNIDTESLPKYRHVYEDGRAVSAKAYPEFLLGDFRRHFREVWLPRRAVDYFRPRDSNALQFLPKLISISAAPPPPAIRYRKAS